MTRAGLGGAATVRALAASGLLLAALVVGAGRAGAQPLDVEASPNLQRVAVHGEGAVRSGTDLAFWGDLAVMGNEDPGGFRVLDISAADEPRLVGEFVCPGRQNDVSVWRHLVVVSVDTVEPSATCGASAGAGWEGLRLVSIADPANPVQVGAVATPCGSHTHTILPDGARGARPWRLLVYVASYPHSGSQPGCPAGGHEQVSIVEVPLAAPAAARVVGTVDVSPAAGCHDVFVSTRHRLAVAACLDESQLWDLADPLRPRVLAHIRNPSIALHHSAALSWDGRTVVLGDEDYGSGRRQACAGPGRVRGGLWFYDISSRSAPVLRSAFAIPQVEPSTFCTAHNYSLVPLRGGGDVLVTGWFNGGTHVVDFTDPAAPRQRAWYLPRRPIRASAWSSYWYRGRIWVSNYRPEDRGGDTLSRGLEVLRLDDTLVAGAIDLPRLNPQLQEPLDVGRGGRVLP